MRVVRRSHLCPTCLFIRLSHVHVHVHLCMYFIGLQQKCLISFGIGSTWISSHLQGYMYMYMCTCVRVLVYKLCGYECKLLHGFEFEEKPHTPQAREAAGTVFRHKEGIYMYMCEPRLQPACLSRTHLVENPFHRCFRSVCLSVCPWLCF